MEKVKEFHLNALPAIIEPGAKYYIRKGDMVTLYVGNREGTAAVPLDGAASVAAATEARQVTAQTQAALAEVTQAGQQAVDLGTQALEQAGRIPVATFAELGANHADAPLGTWGYTADTRITYRKEAPGADGWVQHGEGAAPMSAVLDKQPTLSGVADYARTPSPDIVNNAPVRGPEVLDMAGRKLRVYADSYGQFDNSTVFSVFANPERMPGADPARPPRTTVAGYGSREELSGYLGRDTVGAFVGAYARRPQESIAAQTTYTANSVYAPGVDLSKLVPGMVVDTRHGPTEKLHRWSGFVQSVNLETQTITVDKWTRNTPGKTIEIVDGRWINVETGVPENGVAVRVNAETQMFSLNTILWAAADSQAKHGTGYELDVMNYIGDFDPAAAPDDRVEFDGLSVISTGGADSKLNRYGAMVGGNWYVGYISQGAAEAGYVVLEGSPNSFTGARGYNPTHGYLDSSKSKRAYRSANEHDISFIDEAETREASYFANGSGPYGIVIQGQYYNPLVIRDRTATPSDVVAVAINPGGPAVADLGNNATPFVADWHAPGTNNDFSVRIGSWVNGRLEMQFAPEGEKRLDLENGVLAIAHKQVVGPRQPAIPDSSGTAADNQRAINAILAAMRAHGLIEP